MIRKRFYSMILAGLLAFAALTLASCSDDDDVSSKAASNKAALDESGTLLVGDRSGNIYELNRNSGADTLITAITFTGGITGFISAMAYNPTNGKLFMGMGGNDGCNACIAEIDLSAATGTYLDVGPDLSTAGIAVRSDGAVFANSDTTLYTLDSTTGAVTTLGVLSGGVRGMGLTFDSSDVLYGGQDQDMYTMDQASGAATLVAAFSYPDIAAFQAIDATFGAEPPKLVSLATHFSTGVTHGILNDSSGGAGFRYLVTVNLATAAITLVGEVSNQFDGLTWVY